MSLRSAQIKDLLRLYEDGLSVTDIAKSLHVATTDVEPFIPTGELLLAYQKVREAKLEVASTKTLLDNLNAADALYVRDGGLCSDAIDELNVAIKDSVAQTKVLRSTLKSVKARANTIAEALEVTPTGTVALTYDIKCDALIMAEEDLALAVKADALKRQKAADAVARKQKAEMLAEQALIAAAVGAAKGVVAKSIDDRLKREEQNA